MFSQKLWLVVIANTLLLQGCIADEALSTVKTSSGRSLYSSVDSQNSNIEITPDSFSKSDSSFSASQSEISQNESSMVNTGSGTSLQDSSFYSSSNNVSGSNSNTVAGDGFISQTDSNFESSSSTTAESDTSITTTPNSTVMSSTTSASTSTTSSSSVTSSSINGQFLDSGEADISLPDNFPPIGPSYETKSLDSIPDFGDNSLEQKTVLGSPLSKFPPSLGLKPFMGSPNPNLPPNFPKFPNSSATNQFKNFGPKGPYSPVGTFNSKPTPKIGTPVGPAGMSTSFLPQQGNNPLTSSDISKPFPPLSNSPINSPIISGLDKPLPTDSLPNNPLQNDDLSPTSPLQQLPETSLIDDKTHQPLGSDSIPGGLIPNDISSPNPSSSMPSSDLSTPLSDQPTLENIPSGSIDSTSISQNVNLGINQNISPDSIIDQTSSDLTNPIHGDGISNSSLQPLSPSMKFPPNMSSHESEFPDFPIDHHSSSPNDSMPNSSETNIPIEFHSDSDEIPDDYQPDMHSQLPEPLDSPINPHSFPPNDYSSSSIDDALKDWNLSDYPITPGPSTPSTGLPTDSGIPTISNPLMDDTTTPSPYDSTSNHLHDNDSPNLSDYPITSSPSIASTGLPTDSGIPTISNPLTDDTTIPSPYNSTPDHLYDNDSPFPQLPSQQPYDILKDSPACDEDLPTSPYNLYEHPELPSIPDLDSSPTIVSMDTNQDGFISPEEILESNNPTSLKSSPIDIVPDSSMDVNQDGFTSPEEILESNNLTSVTSPNSSPLDTIPDTSYLSQPVYDNSSILPGDKEYPSPGQFSPNDELPLPLNEQSMPQPPYPKYNHPQKPKLPYDQFPGPKGPFKAPYPGFNPLSLGYPLNEYPQFPNNNFPFSQGPNFRKYPPYLPYGNDLLNYPPFSPLYPFPYGPLRMSSPYYPGSNPLLYDYPRNYGPPSPLLNQPSKPDFYNTSPSFSPGNPLINKPLYPEGPLFDSPKRPPYMPKNWSKISKSGGSPYSPDVLPTPSPASLDSLPLNQPSPDIPPESLLPQLPYDSPIPDSPLAHPYFSPDSTNDLPLMTQPSDTLPLIDSPSAISDFPPSPTPLNPNSGSPMDSLPLNLDSNLPLATLDIPKDQLTPKCMDDEIFDILKQQYESTTAEYQLSNSIYPKDIAPNFDTLTDVDLTFNFVVLGSSPAALAALKTLSDTGKSILLVERGDLPPHISKSLYYRPKILQSNYVRKIKSSAPHCNVEKILYAPNVLGEESTYDSNVWDYGVRSKYIKWGKLGKKWLWNNIIEYFTDSSGQPDTCAIPVSTEIEDTKAVNAVTKIFNDAGLYRTAYEKGKRLEGLTVIPYLQENGNNVILAEKTFQQLTSCNNIQLALNTTPESIIFDNVGKAIGVVVKTPCGGTKIINILDELIIGTNPVDTVQFLYQSGIGDHERLQALNIPTQINLPYVGKELIITPLHFGVLYLFPQGTLLCDNESDFVGKDYLFGRYGLPSALAVDYLKAALNIYEAREANVVFNFRVFSKSMSERLQSYIQRLTHIDEKIKDFLTNLCQEYDLLLAVPQLTNVLSRGEIVIDNSSGQLEALVDTGMYKSKRDITIMQKALKVLKSLAETETFKAMNGKVIQIPVEQCGQPDFSTEYNRCSIRYLSLPNLHYCGGTIMGVSPLTSVVNEDLLLHGSLNVRILSQSVVPYGTSTDSGAVSSLIGNLGAHIISQKYIS